jgi:hypothetical protein
MPPEQPLPAAPDHDDGLGSGRDGVSSAEDREIHAVVCGFHAGLPEAVAPRVEARGDEDAPRRARQEEADVGAPQAQRRISS